MVISADARPVPVIWNATAGQKKRGPIAPPGPDQLKEALAAAGVIARIIPTDSEEEAHSVVEDAIAGGEKLIVGAGGDGTIGAIGKQLLGTDVALGLLPLGSVMNIARMLAVPRELDQAAAVLAARREAMIDVGEANGEIFFEAASVGIQAAVFRHAQQFENGDWGSPFKAVLEAFRYNPARMELLLDDDLQVATRALIVTVSNAPYAGVGMTVAPDARLNDGKFDVRIFSHFSKWERARHLASSAFGRRRYSPHVTTQRSTNVTVVGKRPLPCRADSHDLGTTPLECHMRPASLKVIVGPDYVDGRAPAEDKS
ncbi:MAG: diacylglycerol/lipid kinase family protein [Halobacteriota archaeon]